MIPELIAKENIPLVWPLIGPRLYAAMEKVKFIEMDIGQVYALLIQEQAQLWVGNNGEMIAITRIVQYPNVKRLVIEYIEGKNHKDYADHMAYLEHWAIQNGATQAEAELRPGLLREARRQGWTKSRVKMFKTLERGLH